jgi:CBS domain-containing protein
LGKEETMQRPRLAKDIMVSRLVVLSPRTPVFDGIRQLLRHRITGAPVVDADQRYLGVFSEKCCMGVLSLIARQAAERQEAPVRTPLVRDFMVTSLVTLDPSTDVFDAIGFLLRNAISGAPVVDADGKYLGIFSEKTSMRVLVDAAYDQIPSTEVAAFVNADPGRLITEENDLLHCAQMFIETPYRRLPVLRNGKVVGQVSRRDVLIHAHIVSTGVQDKDSILMERGNQIDLSDSDLVQTAAALESAEVGQFMDCNARTITEDVDVLSIAQTFLTTPYRRLPVLRGVQLAGQVSRRDLLHAMHRSLEQLPRREKSLLYLSSLCDRTESPIE